MTTEIKLPFDKDYVSSFSKDMGEPAWLTELRLNALANAESLPMPRPDKTKIDKWNFTQFEKHIVGSEDFTSLNDLPEDVRNLIDTEAGDQNLYIQRNNRPTHLAISKELQEKGVIFTDIFTAAREHSEICFKSIS